MLMDKGMNGPKGAPPKGYVWRMRNNGWMLERLVHPNYQPPGISRMMWFYLFVFILVGIACSTVSFIAVALP